MTVDGTSMDDALGVLACEYEKRPKGAPSFFDLQDAVRGVRREAGALIVEFEPGAGGAVEELAAAERLCCSTIAFDVAHAPTLTLRIGAAPAQLDIFEQFLVT